MEVGIASLNKLQGNWRDIRRIIPYGFGHELKKRIKRIVDDFEIPFIIDSDAKKWGQNYYGIEIVSPEHLCEVKAGDKVLIALAGRKRREYNAIKNTLLQYNLHENFDFCHLGQFAMEWYYRYKQEYCLYMVDMAVTTACTLKCKNCNMFIPYYQNPIMYSFDAIKNSIDLLMQRVDYLFGIGFLGGEAFLNPVLGKVISYVKSTWSHKIGVINITTNGITVPDERMLDILKKENVVVEISDYTPALPGRSHVPELVSVLKNKGILYGVLYNREWCRTGFPEEPWDVPEGNVQKHMLQCNGWRGLNDGKYFFCNIAWSIEKTGLFRLSLGDYIDLEKLPAGDIETKKAILDFSLGNLPNGYMSFCKVCGGCGPDNHDFVLAGEQ